MSKEIIPGRIAFREEGTWWNVYYALPDTMEGAIHMASIRMAMVQNPDRKKAFMELMKHAITEFFASRGATIDHFKEMIPPEKTGHG